MTDLHLSPESMRLMIQLRRLLASDHDVHVDMAAEQPWVQLLDATRECRDRKADMMAEAVCEALSRSNPDSLVDALRARLRPGFSPPLHERQVGFRPGKVYRGQRVRDEQPSAPSPVGAPVAPEPEPEPEPEHAQPDAPPRRVLVYRGQKRVV